MKQQLFPAHWNSTVILPRAMPRLPGRATCLANCRLEAPDMNSKQLYNSKQMEHLTTLLAPLFEEAYINRIKSSTDTRVSFPCSVFQCSKHRTSIRVTLVGAEGWQWVPKIQNPMNFYSIIAWIWVNFSICRLVCRFVNRQARSSIHYLLGLWA
jgi:hypothetical protein